MQFASLNDLCMPAIIGCEKLDVRVIFKSNFCVLSPRVFFEGLIETLTTYYIRPFCNSYKETEKKNFHALP